MPVENVHQFSHEGATESLERRGTIESRAGRRVHGSCWPNNCVYSVAACADLVYVRNQLMRPLGRR